MNKTDFSKYDNMMEEQLEKVLIENVMLPETELMGEDEIEYICGILAEFDKANPPEPLTDFDETMENFIMYYVPEEDRERLRSAYERKKAQERQT